MADALSRPSPDLAHEELRLSLLRAIGDLRNNTSATDVSFDLADTLFLLLDSALYALDDLAARVTALENPTT